MKNFKKVLKMQVSSAFELVAGNSPYCDKITCHRQAMC